MKVTNKTSWRTDQIRAIVSRVARVELDPEKRRDLRVVVDYRITRSWHRRIGSTAGQAVIGGSWMKLLLPTGERVDPVLLAHTTAHEMAHIRGMTHAQMRGSPSYSWVPGWADTYAWATAMPLEQKPQKPKPTTEEKRATRLKHAMGMLFRWTRKAAAAQRRASRWRERVKNLERRPVGAVDAPPNSEGG